MAETVKTETENMDTTEDTTEDTIEDTTEDTINQDIDKTINELSELVKEEAVVGDKDEEETKEDGDMDDSTEKKDDTTTEKKDSSEESAKKKKKKPTIIDKTQRPPLVKVVAGEVIINKFKMKDAKMKDFFTVLSKSESFVFEYNIESIDENRVGTITLQYKPKKDFKSLAILGILADLKDFNPEIEILGPDVFMNELDAELYGIRRTAISQAKDKTLYVNDITNAASEEFLRALVPDCTKAQIPVDSEGNRRGWGVLEFRNGKEADECMRTVKEIELGDEKVIITRAEASDPADVEKAKEVHNNKPIKRRKPVQTPAKEKDKKRQWNQGPGMLGPHPLMGGSPKGSLMGRAPQGGGFGANRRIDYDGDRYSNRSSSAGNQQGRYGNQDQYGGYQGQYGGNKGQYGGSQGQYGGSQGQYGGSQGQYGGSQREAREAREAREHSYGQGDRSYNKGGFQHVQQARQKLERYSDGDEDNMLDFLQSAIQEIKNKKSSSRTQQYPNDSWRGSGGYDSSYDQQGGYEGGYGQQEGYGQDSKRRRDNWNSPAESKSWGSSKSNQQSWSSNKGQQQQQGLGVWKTKGGNQQSNKGGGGQSYSNYGGGYGTGNGYEQYDSYSTYSGRY